jgi:hypothetical protein
MSFAIEAIKPKGDKKRNAIITQEK